MNTNSKLLVTLVFLTSTFLQQAFSQSGLRINYSQSFDVAQEQTSMTTGRDFTEAFNTTFIGSSTTQSFGIQYTHDFGHLYFDGGAEYRTTGLDFMISEFQLESPVLESKASIRNTFLSIPLVAGLQKGNFNIGVGPRFNFLLDQSIENGDAMDFQSVEQSLQTNFQFTVGYEFFDRVQLSASYERALHQARDHFSIADKETQLKSSPNLLTIGLGVRIF